MLKNQINHIGLILDGNRRWGKENNISLEEAYIKGKENSERIVNYLADNELCKEVSLWVLSDNNLKRDKSECETLFRLIEDNFIENLQLNKNIRFIGSSENLPKNILDIIDKYSKKELIHKFTVNVFFNYSWGWDQKTTIDNIKNNISDNNHTYKYYSPCSKISNFDLLIRTGRHKRLSNFCLDLLGYSEIYFLEKLWPDFTINDLNKIINEFQEERICTYGK